MMNQERTFATFFGLTPFSCKIASPLESPSKNRPSSQNQSQNVKVTDGATVLSTLAYSAAFLASSELPPDHYGLIFMHG